jgi:hypothetical protein
MKIALLIALLIANIGNAAVLVADSASLLAVSNAVSAAVSGDVVQIPAGAVAWESYLAVNKSIQLLGPGTNLLFVTNLSGIAASPTISIETTDGGQVRVSGMTLVGSDATASTGRGIIVNGSATHQKQTRIDNVWFFNFSDADSYAIFTYRTVYGVVDSCRFTDSYVTWYVQGHDNISWRDYPTPGIGTTNSLYFEDNRVDYTGAKDPLVLQICQNGGRLTMRYNSGGQESSAISNPTWFDSHAIQNCAATNLSDENGLHASVHLVAYGNTWTNNSPSFAEAGLFKGGTVMVFSNTWVGFTGGFQLIESGDNLGCPVSTAGRESITNSWFWRNTWGSNWMFPYVNAEDNSYVQLNTHFTTNSTSPSVLEFLPYPHPLRAALAAVYGGLQSRQPQSGVINPVGRTH